MTRYRAGESGAFICLLGLLLGWACAPPGGGSAVPLVCVNDAECPLGQRCLPREGGTACAAEADVAPDLAAAADLGTVADLAAAADLSPGLFTIQTIAPVAALSCARAYYERIVSTPAGIDCGRDAAGSGNRCKASFPAGSKVTLRTVRTHPGLRFDRWGGACSGTMETCDLTGAAGATLAAEARYLPEHELDMYVSIAPTRIGAVSATPRSDVEYMNSGGGSYCGGSAGSWRCCGIYAPGTVVTVGASGTGSYFVSTGTCAAKSCTVTINGKVNVSGTFN